MYDFKHTFAHYGVIALIGFGLASAVHAQSAGSNSPTLRHSLNTRKKSNAYHQAIQIRQEAQRAEAHLDSLIRTYREWKYTGSDTLSNPYYASLMGSPTLYGRTIRRAAGADELGAAPPTMPNLPDGEPDYGSIAAHQQEILTATDRILIAAYTEFPWFVSNEEEEHGTLDVVEQIKDGVKSDISLTERFFGRNEPPATPSDILPGGEPTIIVRKPNFWTFKTSLSFQFTQNYISDNWYKGGESHNALLASAIIDANYNNRQKITFDNRLEMKIGFQTSPNDNEHKFRTNSDLIRLTNKLGLRAVKYWYYTVMLQSWTQFYHGYKANDKKVYSDFMSPFESLLSLGMTFNWTGKKKKFNVGATFSPLALKLKYCDRDALVTSFGIDKGKNALWDYGSNVTINFTWQMAKSISWRSRIYYFTDYSKSQLEWENTFSLSINKYLTTSLFLYPRFDDSVKANKDKKYFQFNELLSLGLNLNF